MDVPCKRNKYGLPILDSPPVNPASVITPITPVWPFDPNKKLNNTEKAVLKRTGGTKEGLKAFLAEIDQATSQATELTDFSPGDILGDKIPNFSSEQNETDGKLSESQGDSNGSKAKFESVCINYPRTNLATDPTPVSSQANVNEQSCDHAESSDLDLATKCEHGSSRSGMCSASKQFDNVDQTQVCLSTDRAKQKGHSVTESIHNLATKCDVMVGENQPTLQDPEIRLQHLKYFASLDANDLLELADHFKIPRQKVEPHVKAMLSVFHFMANELLE